MDDDSKSKTKNEAAKDGYIQLAEKMEQVRSQMMKMERKYDELYQTVKDKEHSRNPSVTVDQMSENSKSQRESITVEQGSSAKTSIAENSPNAPPKPPEEQEKPAREMDIEKLEDNPFL